MGATATQSLQQVSHNEREPGVGLFARLATSPPFDSQPKPGRVKVRHMFASLLDPRYDVQRVTPADQFAIQPSTQASSRGCIIADMPDQSFEPFFMIGQIGPSNNVMSSFGKRVVTVSIGHVQLTVPRE